MVHDALTRCGVTKVLIIFAANNLTESYRTLTQNLTGPCTRLRFYMVFTALKPIQNCFLRAVTPFLNFVLSNTFGTGMYFMKRCAENVPGERALSAPSWRRLLANMRRLHAQMPFPEGRRLGMNSDWG